ncbi:unnamed protein product [Symbiodinium microadriaticum]|nr:unnamed protein product [Symbiodinium microadriaticum]
MRQMPMVGAHVRSAVTAKLRPKEDSVGEDEPERAFQVSPEAIVAAPCEVEFGHQADEPVGLKNIDARNIDIYLYSQEAGAWQRVENESEVLRRNTIRSLRLFAATDSLKGRAM